MNVIFQLKLNFIDRFPENIQISNLIKPFPSEAVFFHIDGSTDG
jgi:hypothetical protein